MSQALQDFGWCIVELMGHRRLGGHVREHVIAGAPFVRVDVAAPDAAQGYSATQYYGASAVYCITPTSEDVARALARSAQPAPVQRWELERRQLASGSSGPDDEELDDEESDAEEHDRPAW